METDYTTDSSTENEENQSYQQDKIDQIDQLRTQNERLQEHNTQLQKSLDSIKQQLQDAIQYKTTISSMGENIQALNDKLNEAYEQNKKLTKQLQQAQLKHDHFEKSNKEIIQNLTNDRNESLQNIQKLNEKYNRDQEKIPLFSFIYRKRVKNEKEGSYLGWERKRGLINQFNEYILGNIENPFKENTIESKIKEGNENLRNYLKNIKYIITLDADTDLILNSAFELVGAMAHILNKPVINEKKGIVEEGYGIIQPRVGVNLDISYKTLFTKIFAGAGGFDSYSNAISDTYQDNFGEGIFTGKGIYDLHVFSKILRNKIPENTVLSHDLLEGCFL